MNKSSKMVSIFLATAIVLSTAGCSTEQQVVYDEDGDPIVQEDDSDQGFFGGGFFAPFGFFKGRSYGSSSKAVRPSGVSSGSSLNSDTSKSNAGITGVSPGGRGGSTSASGGSSASGGTGITSGSHGGIGGGGSSAS